MNLLVILAVAGVWLVAVLILHFANPKRKDPHGWHPGEHGDEP